MIQLLILRLEDKGFTPWETAGSSSWYLWYLWYLATVLDFAIAHLRSLALNMSRSWDWIPNYMWEETAYPGIKTKHLGFVQIADLFYSKMSGKSWDSILFPVILTKLSCVPVGSLKRICYTAWNVTPINFIDCKCMYRQYQVSMAAKKKVLIFFVTN